MASKKSRARTYRVEHYANDGKLQAIRDLLPVWQRALVHMQFVQVRRMRQGHQPGWLTPEERRALPDYLSQRQWANITEQAAHALRSWQALAKIEFRRLVRDYDIEDDVLADLHTINNLAAWWSQDMTVTMSASKTVKVSQTALDYAGYLIGEVLRSCPFPHMSRVRTMVMDGKTIASESSRTSVFDRWLRVSTLTKRKPVLVPISTTYLDRQEGFEAGVIQVHVADDGEVTFSRVKMSDAAERSTSPHSIGLDWGLANLFTTSEGERLGQKFMGTISRLDEQLTELQKSLSRNNIKFKDSKRWRNLTRRIRAYVKNEVNRILNWVVNTYDIGEIVVEDLDFRDGGLSRRMNRILSRAGRAAVKAKLAAIEEDHGITSTAVNPAYTSQQCSGCGYAAKANRTSQKRFRCRFCGKVLNADVNAARNIRERRSLPDDGLRWHDKRSVLSIVDRTFEDRWSFDAADLRERHQRGQSAAMSASTAA